MDMDKKVELTGIVQGLRSGDEYATGTFFKQIK
jgi:hypothetical protein